MKRIVSLLAPELLVVLGCSLAAFGWVWWRPAGPPAAEASPILTSDNRTVDCGAASLYVVCKAAGREQPLDYLRTLTKTSDLGTSMLYLKEAAEAVGLEVEACRVPFRLLHEHVAKPNHYAILHSRIGHFAAVMAVADEDRVRVLDNALGVQDLAEDDFTRIYQWEGAVLLLKAPPDKAE
jgi:ATP-binding cassette subfamily B protein